MKIRTILLWLAVFVPAGFAIYQVKFEVQQLEEDYESVQEDISDEKEAIRVLRAEWSHLNEPGRIEALSGRHLGLKPVDQQQMLSIEDVPFREEPAAQQGKPPVAGEGETGNRSGGQKPARESRHRGPDIRDSQASRLSYSDIAGR